jgi:hypothetical protein
MKGKSTYPIVLVIVFGLLITGFIGCGSDEGKNTVLTTPGIPAQFSDDSTEDNADDTGLDTIDPTTQNIANNASSDSTSTKSTNVLKRIDPGNAMNLIDLPPHEYSVDVNSFIQRTSLDFFFKYTGTFVQPRIGSLTSSIKYSEYGRTRKSGYLKTLTRATTIPFIKEKSLNSLFVLTAAIDLNLLTQNRFEYLHDEDQNKIQFELTEIARDNTRIAFRVIRTFIAPQTGKIFDGGLLLIQPNKSGENGLFVGDTLTPVSITLLKNQEDRVMALAFKAKTRLGKSVDAIFEVGITP